MNKLRIKNKDIYRIEVNDEGECIEFDLADIGLKVKCYKALDEIEKVAERYKEKVQIVQDDKELSILENNTFIEMRKAMDIFLGEGACQKIFGNRNYLSMFDDLMKELTRKRKELGGKSHFDMLKLSSKDTNDRIINKYNKNKKKVI